MLIKSAEFIKSSTTPKNGPPAELPEYAFIGRSNVGKSSLINLLTGRRSLAKTSVTPGKTQLINHFLINEEWYLVDLPGLGYARTSRKDRSAWESMIGKYLSERENLAYVFVLIDIRHEALPIDLALMDNLNQAQIPFALVFTKTDKLTRNELASNTARYRKTLLTKWEVLPRQFFTSALKKTGHSEILDLIAELNTAWKKVR